MVIYYLYICLIAWCKITKNETDLYGMNSNSVVNDIKSDNQLDANMY